jgi:TH1 protein
MSQDPGTAEREKWRLSSKFLAGDYILESDSVEAYEELARRGGDLEIARQKISEKYEGNAGIANRLASWLELAGGDPEEIIGSVVGSHLTNGTFQVKLADQAFTSISGSDKGPSLAFLNAVARSDRWWPYVKTLGATGRSGSVLLEALRHLHSASDDAAECCNTPKRCLDVIKTSLEKLMTKPVVTDADINAFHDLAVESATYDELTLVIWLRVLGDAAVDSQNVAVKSLLRRCSQLIREKAVQRAVEVGHASEQDALAFVTRVGILIDTHAAGIAVPPGLLTDLWSVVSARADGKPTPATALKNVDTHFAPLRPAKSLDEADDVASEDEEPQEVSEIPDSKRAAYLGMLARPEVMKCMWKKLFVQSVRAPKGPFNVKADVDEPVRNCLCMLLALAAVFLRQSNGVFQSMTAMTASPTVLPIEGMAQRRAVRELEDQLLTCVVVCEHLYPNVPARRFDDLLSSLPSLPVKTDEPKTTLRARLKEGIFKSSVVAYGVVMWAREGLLTKIDPDKLAKSCVNYLELLELVAEQYPLWRDEIIELYADAYGHQIWAKTDADRNLSQESKLRGFYGNALQSMVRLRCATRVVELYRTRFAGSDAIDTSDVRTFVSGLVQIVSGRCSPPFAAALLRLLATPRVAEVFRNAPTVQAAQKSHADALSRIRKIVSELPTEMAANSDATLLERVRKLYGLTSEHGPGAGQQRS